LCSLQNRGRFVEPAGALQEFSRMNRKLAAAWRKFTCQYSVGDRRIERPGAASEPLAWR
jgi:hypothetical protein